MREPLGGKIHTTGQKSDFHLVQYSALVADRRSVSLLSGRFTVLTAAHVHTTCAPPLRATPPLELPQAELPCSKPSSSGLPAPGAVSRWSTLILTPQPRAPPCTTSGARRHGCAPQRRGWAVPQQQCTARPRPADTQAPENERQFAEDLLLEHVGATCEHIFLMLQSRGSQGSSNSRKGMVPLEGEKRSLQCGQVGFLSAHILGQDHHV
jgi:hypothetical protein